MKYAYVNESMVNRIIAKTKDAYWDGWTLVLWRPTPDGYSHERGMFRRGQWGIASTFHLQDNGKWMVPKRLVA